MKTKRYTTVMLIALVFASTNIQAQSARRSTQESKEQAKSTQSVRKAQPQQARSTQPARKVQPQQARSTQPARKVQTQQARSTQPARKVQTQQARSTESSRKLYDQQARKPVSMTSNNNPRSTYRRANNMVTAEPRHHTSANTKKYHNRDYYGGKYYHYAYPTRKVTYHYHHDTYIHHYNVLYYPTYTNIYWTRNMYRNYRSWYPEFNWRYNYGYRIQTISVFDAQYNLGEVAMVYGRVYATWHNEETDDFLLFFGGDFPYQQFTVVVPGHIARKFSWRPENYFLGEHITITGLITTFDGSPEIVVKNKHQLGLY